MPRNKTARRVTKRENTKHSVNQYQALEKEFMGLPGKFADQVKRDIHAHKQQETRLKAAWNKSRKAISTAEAKVRAAAKSKTTAAGKKQFNACKKMVADAVQHHSALKKQIADIANMVNTLVTKHARLAALSKYLTLFNREWAKKAKGTRATKATKRAKRKTTTVKKATAAAAPQEHTYDAPPAATVYSDVSVGETTEAAS